MYPRIPWVLFTDPLGSAEHTLRTADMDDRVSSCSLYQHRKITSTFLLQRPCNLPDYTASLPRFLFHLQRYCIKMCCNTLRTFRFGQPQKIAHLQLQWYQVSIEASLCSEMTSCVFSEGISNVVQQIACYLE